MPAKTIVFTNVKGGPGKTTLAMNVASTWAHQAKVLVIDADPMQSAMQWSAAAPEGEPLPFAVFGYPQEKLHQTLKQVLGDYDFVIVDTPPSQLAVSAITKSALIPADLAVVPVTPSAADIREVIKTHALLSEVTSMRQSAGLEALSTCVAINRHRPQTTMGKEVRGALGPFGIPVLETTIGLREIYTHPPLDGCTIFQERSHGYKEASEETRRLADELKQRLNGYQ